LDILLVLRWQVARLIFFWSNMNNKARSRASVTCTGRRVRWRVFTYIGPSDGNAIKRGLFRSISRRHAIDPIRPTRINPSRSIHTQQTLGYNTLQQGIQWPTIPSDPDALGSSVPQLLAPVLAHFGGCNEVSIHISNTWDLFQQSSAYRVSLSLMTDCDFEIDANVYQIPIADNSAAGPK